MPFGKASGETITYKRWNPWGHSEYGATDVDNLTHGVGSINISGSDYTPTGYDPHPYGYEYGYPLSNAFSYGYPISVASNNYYIPVPQPHDLIGHSLCIAEQISYRTLRAVWQGMKES